MRRAPCLLIRAVVVVQVAVAAACARDVAPEPVAPGAIPPFATDATSARDRFDALERETAFLRGIDAAGRLCATLGMERWQAERGPWTTVRAAIEGEVRRRGAAVRATLPLGERSAVDDDVQRWITGRDLPGAEWAPGLDLLLPRSEPPRSADPGSDVPGFSGAIVSDATGTEVWRCGTVPSAGDGVQVRGHAIRGPGDGDAGRLVVGYRASALGTASFSEALDSGGIAAVRLLAGAGLDRWTPDRTPDEVREEIGRRAQARGGAELSAPARQRLNEVLEAWSTPARGTKWRPSLGEALDAASRTLGRRGRATTETGRPSDGLIACAVLDMADAPVFEMGRVPQVADTPERVVGGTRIYAVPGQPGVRVFEHPFAGPGNAGRVLLVLDSTRPAELGPVSGAGEAADALLVDAVFAALRSGPGAGLESLLPTALDICLLETGRPLPVAESESSDGPELRTRFVAEAAKRAESVRASVRTAAADARDDFLLEWGAARLDPGAVRVDRYARESSVLTATFGAVRVDRYARESSVLTATFAFRVRFEDRTYVFRTESVRWVAGRWVLVGDVRHRPLDRGAWLAAVLERPARAAVQALRTGTATPLDEFRAREDDYEWALFFGRSPRWQDTTPNRYPRGQSAASEVDTELRLVEQCRAAYESLSGLPWDTVAFGGFLPDRSSVTTGPDAIRKANLVFALEAGDRRVVVTMPECVRVGRGWVVQNLEVNR